MAVSGRRDLVDGRTVWLREAGPADVPAIARLFTELSREAFRSRFLSGQPSPDLVSGLARIDVRPGMVCIIADTAAGSAAGPGQLAAEARYVPIGDGAAELALTVLDSYQGAGLGRLLLDALAERAPASGIERLRAIVNLSNARMLHLLAPYGWALTEPVEGYSVACLEISAAGGMPGWPAAATGRRVLVEQQGWFDTERLANLRSAGNDIRHCQGPGRQTGRTCPLLTSGRCRLAEEADLIVPMLPGDDEDCAAILQAHQRLWPERLA